MHRASWKYLQFCIRDQVFQFRALPFGLITSPYVFTQLVTAIAIHLRKRAVTLFPYLDDWLVRNQSSNLSKGQTVHPSIDHVLGTHNQSRKMGINPCSNICVHRDGIPHSGKHCQNSCRQSSKCSRISELAPETIISFSQSFPAPSGTSKCYRSVCDTRQIAFTSTSDGFVRTVETSCSTTDSQILISHQIKHHLKW